MPIPRVREFPVSAGRRLSVLASCVIVLGLPMAEARGRVPQSTPGDRAAPSSPPNLRAVEIVRIEIVGRGRARAARVLETLASESIRPGVELRWPRDPRVRRARDRLVASGDFSRVTLRLSPVSSRRDQAALIVEVEERGTLDISDVHLASSRLTPFSGGVSVVERNLFGRGVLLGGGFVVGTRPDPAQLRDARLQHAYELDISVPSLVGRVGVRASARAAVASEDVAWIPDVDRAGVAIDYRRIGGSVGFTLPFSQQVNLGVDLRHEQVQAELPEDSSTAALALHGSDDRNLARHGLYGGRQSLTTAELSVIWDGRSGRAGEPGRGGRFRMDLQLSSPAIASSFEYLKIVIGTGYTWSLPWQHWFTAQVVGGQIAGLAPRFERFHPGELHRWSPGRTLGISYSRRGPVDVFGLGLGRQGLATIMGRVDLEYSLPLFNRIRTAFFREGRMFVALGVFIVAGDRDQRSQRRELGLAPAPVGLDADVGFEFRTAIGSLEISAGNLLPRLPL